MDIGPKNVAPRTGTKGVPREEREHQIVEAAMLAFGTRGFAATSIADVAAAAGISKPLIYNYFGSKDGLHAACLARGAALLGGEVERIAREEPVGIERGINTLDAIFAVLEGRRHVWRLLYDPSIPEVGPSAETAAAYHDRMHELAVEGVGELLGLAGITDPDDVDAATVTWSGVINSAMDWWIDRPDQSAKDMMDRVGRVAMALFMDADRNEEALP